MEIDLTPKLAKKVYGGNGGNYYAWCPDELPMLREANIGAAKLSLEKDGFALPRYSDSPKVAYVLQGSGVAGIVLPEKEEKVLPIKTGDSIALPFGVVSWWYNKEDTELIILFLGETSKGHKAGSFTDFFLTGTNGIFTGFTTEFVGRAWDLEESVVKTLVGNQSGITGGGWLRNWKLKLLVENWSSQRRFSSMMLRTIRPGPIDSGFFKILEGGKMNLPIVRKYLKRTF